MEATNAMTPPAVDDAAKYRRAQTPGLMLKRLWPPLPVWKRLNFSVLVVMLYSTAIVSVQELTAFSFSNQTAGGLLTLMNSIILGILLGFRNKESYERWWEARKLWGQLVNDSRNLSLKVKAMNGVPAVEQGRVGRLIAGFAIALRNHLRGSGTLRDVPGFESDPASPAHVPLHLAGQVAASARAWRRAGYMTEFDLLWIDPHVKALMDVAGACERIKNTPIPLSYRSLLRHGLVLYLLLTPWFVADEMHWMAIPVMGLLAYFLMGIELTAEDVEEPFGRDDDDLALSVYCETIRKSVGEVFGLSMAPVPNSVYMPGLRPPAGK
jgi:putative membrane protein